MKSQAERAHCRRKCCVERTLAVVLFAELRTWAIFAAAAAQARQFPTDVKAPTGNQRAKYPFLQNKSLTKKLPFYLFRGVFFANICIYITIEAVTQVLHVNYTQIRLYAYN